jgi:hypothetical protein
MSKIKFIVTRRNENVTVAQLISELKRVYKKLKKNITKSDFDLHSKYGSHLVVRKIGWNNAKVKAKIPVKKEMNISDKKLMDNIMSVWLKLKRQPKREDLLPPLSNYSVAPYRERYGSWQKALDTFESLVKNRKIDAAKLKKISKPVYKHTTSRHISQRMRLKVLVRDKFTCKVCKVSLINNPRLSDEDFEVDHVKPYSKGGETVMSNLQTLCKKHNRTKGNQLLKIPK